MKIRAFWKVVGLEVDLRAAAEFIEGAEKREEDEEKETLERSGLWEQKE